MYSLIEYSDNYSKTGSSCQYYRVEAALNNGVIANFSGNSVSFKFKQKIIG